MIRLIKRVIYEIYIPSTLITKKIIQSFVKIKNFLKFKDKKIFLACWDLAAAGPSFDFGFFLASADFVSQKKGYAKFQVVIIESKSENFGINSENEENNWRLVNIIFPLCKMYERCEGFEYIRSKKNLILKLKQKNVELYPLNYDFNHIKVFEYSDFIFEKNLFNFITGFSANKIALQHCKNLFNNKKKIVTITLRTDNFSSPINKKNFNSKNDEWLRVCKYLLNQNYNVIIIPDTFTIVPEDFIKIGCKPFNESSLNLMLRMAIYELAEINLFVPNGPATLAYLNKKVDYIVFKFFTEGVMYAPGVEEATEDARWNQFKMKRGEGWKFSKKKQIISSYEDDSNDIINEFNRVMSIKD